MAKITKFEDIEAWRLSRELTKRIYEASSRGGFSRDFGLRDQIRRAAISVMSNIAEAFERGGDKEFRQFLSLAKGSAGELKSQLYVAADVGLLSQDQFKELYSLANDTARMVAGFMRYLGGSELKGSKYR
jgi:four helix bundle protein